MKVPSSQLQWKGNFHIAPIGMREAQLLLCSGGQFSSPDWKILLFDTFNYAVNMQNEDACVLFIRSAVSVLVSSGN